MEIGFEHTPNKEQKDLTIQKCELMMNEWEKMPDSWISPEDYRSGNKEKLESQRKNKFRVNYFNGMTGHCMNLFGYLSVKDREIFSKKLSSISVKVRQQADNKLPITEDLIDTMDSFARSLIEKIRYENN